MALTLEISLDKELREIDGFFNKLRFQAVTLAARQGLNRAAMRLKTASKGEVAQVRRMKAGDIAKRIAVVRATGTNLADLEARVTYSGVPLPIILFLIGQKTPRKQSRPNAQRRSLQFEIETGKRKPKKGLFVERAGKGQMQYQVYRRKSRTDRSAGFRAQSVPSMADALRNRTDVLGRIEDKGRELLKIEFSRALAYQLSKLRL